MTDLILNDENWAENEKELRVQKIQGQKTAIYARGTNPVLFNCDGDKLTTSAPMLPTVYSLFQQDLMERKGTGEDFDCGAIRIYLKLQVEKFLMKGADLMWPGVWNVSSSDFPVNSMGVIYAHRSLVSDYISTLDTLDKEASEDEEESKENQDGENGEEVDDSETQKKSEEQSQKEFLREFIPIGCGRMCTAGVPASRKGKAVEVYHILFDKLWNSGNRIIHADLLTKTQKEEENKNSEATQDKTEEAKEEEQIEESKQVQEESDSEYSENERRKKKRKGGHNNRRAEQQAQVAASIPAEP